MTLQRRGKEPFVRLDKGMIIGLFCGSWIITGVLLFIHTDLLSYNASLSYATALSCVLILLWVFARKNEVKS